MNKKTKRGIKSRIIFYRNNYLYGINNNLKK